MLFFDTPDHAFAIAMLPVHILSHSHSSVKIASPVPAIGSALALTDQLIHLARYTVIL
jgi:hypothetical protein